MTIKRPRVTAITSAAYTAINMPEQKMDIAIWTEGGASFTYSDVSNSSGAAVVPADTSVSIPRVEPTAGVALYARTEGGSDNLVLQASKR